MYPPELPRQYMPDVVSIVSPVKHKRWIRDCLAVSLCKLIVWLGYSFAFSLPEDDE